MNAQLLLLLALVGPFCAFTHASPTSLPEVIETATPEKVADVTAAPTEASQEDHSVITGPPATEPAAAPADAEVTTESAVEATPAVTDNTEAAVIETEAPAAATEAPQPGITDAPAVETAAPTEPAEAPVETHVTAPAKTEEDSNLVIEDDTSEGLSSGQVAGIVIGALLAVVIFMAVVIAAVRRMGKYSSAKNKKPAKKDSVVVSPLRKKPGKQQERPKFWKF